MLRVCKYRDVDALFAEFERLLALSRCVVCVVWKFGGLDALFSDFERLLALSKCVVCAKLCVCAVIWTRFFLTLRGRWR
jgi:hypothetical protein